MADAFDPKAFIAGSDPSAAPPADPASAAQPTQGDLSATPAPKVPGGFDPKRFVNGGQATDQLTMSKIPLPLSGNTPETAMNKNPASLSTMDRVNMSLGNESGNIKYLKEKFQDARPILDNSGKPTKDMAVLDQGTWYRVNPKNGDIQDPWERTKEYMKDAATYAPEALGAGVAVLTDIATEGAAVPESAAVAGGVASAVRTSLGRIVGTYDASPMEQAWDIGFESLLNAGGAKILTGVKPSAKFIASKLDGVAEAFKDTVESYTPGVAKQAANAIGDLAGGAADSAKGVLKKVLAGYSVGVDAFDTMVENTQAVKDMMSSLPANVRAYHDAATGLQTDAVQEIADNARGTLSKIYGQMRNKVLANVPENFSVNLDDPVYSAYSKAVQNGYGVLVVGGKELSGAPAAQYVAEKGLYNAGFRMYSQDEMAIQVAKGANLDKGVGALISDKEAYDTLSQFYDGIGKFVGGANRSGLNGARSIMDFKKVASDLSLKMASTDSSKNIPALKQTLDEARTAIDDSVFQSLKKAGVGDDFINMNSTYSNLAQKFQPLLQAKAQFEKTESPKVYEGLLNQFLSRPGKNPGSRDALDEAIMAADSNGLTTLAQNLKDSKVSIQVADAAKKFNPLPDDSKSKTLTAMQFGSAAYIMAHPEPRLIAAAAGVAALTSPKVTSVGIAAVQGLSKGQEMLSSMTKTQVDKFLSSPEAINAFTTGVVQAPLVRAHAEQSLQQVMQAAQQKQQQIQQAVLQQGQRQPNPGQGK